MGASGDRVREVTQRAGGRAPTVQVGVHEGDLHDQEGPLAVGDQVHAVEQEQLVVAPAGTHGSRAGHGGFPRPTATRRSRRPRRSPRPRASPGFTSDIPNVSEEATKDLDENGIIRIGARVEPGDIMIGKISPKGESDPSPEEKLIASNFRR